MQYGGVKLLYVAVDSRMVRDYAASQGELRHHGELIGAGRGAECMSCFGRVRSCHFVSIDSLSAMTQVVNSCG